METNENKRIAGSVLFLISNSTRYMLLLHVSGIPRADVSIINKVLLEVQYNCRIYSYYLCGVNSNSMTA